MTLPSMKHAHLRKVLFGLAVCSAALIGPGCAPEPPRGEMVLVRVLSSEDIRVGENPASLAQLDAIVLNAAAAKNPEMSTADLRANVPIAIAIDGAPSADVAEVGEALRGFERVIYVAEDRRR
jgi:hypothetical protein